MSFDTAFLLCYVSQEPGVFLTQVVLGTKGVVLPQYSFDHPCDGGLRLAVKGRFENSSVLLRTLDLGSHVLVPIQSMRLNLTISNNSH